MEIYYNRLGEGEPLILLHGLGETKEGWKTQYELSDQFDLVIPDLRGHGESRNLNDISISTFAQDVLLLMDQLNIEAAHVCGLSMGGAVAQEIYRQSPERVKSLILVSTFHYMARWMKPFLELKRMEASRLSREDMQERSARRCLYSWNNELFTAFKKGYSPNKKAYELSSLACLGVNNLELLKGMDLPVLVIGGQYDTLLPCRIQIDMHKRIPGSKLIIYKNTGHIAKLEQKDKFNRDVRSFLNVAL